MKIKRSSFSRLLTPILIVGILLFAVLVSIAAYSAYQRERENLENYTHSRMKSLILDLETKLVPTEASMVAQGQRVHLDLKDSTYIYGWLEEMIRNRDFIHHASLDIWDENGPDTSSYYLYVSRMPDGSFEHKCELTIMDLAQDVVMDCFNKAYETGTPTWSRPYMDSVFAEECVVTCYMKAVNKWAMIGVDVGMNSLLETINSLQFYEDSKFYIQVPGGETYTLDDGKLVEVDELNVDERKYIEISAHYRHLNIDIINVVPKDKIYTSLWTNIIIIIVVFIVGLTTIAILVHRSFLNAQRTLASSLQKSQEEQLALKRIEDEVAIASRIQNKMLTEPGRGVHFAIPEVRSVDIMAHMIPAREVGGDLYEYRFTDNKLVMCVGDVSGKGVPASIIMSKCITLFHAYVSDTTEPSPAYILRDMNAQLCRRNEDLMFVTMWIGVLDLSNGHLKYASAGHNPPVLVRNGSAHFLEKCQGAPLGLFKDSAYQNRACSAKYGDAILLYTDGITEAENTEHLLFGDDRLLEACQNKYSTCPGILCHSLLQSVYKHTAGCPQSDDITLMCISCGGRFAQLHGIDDVKALHTLVAECEQPDEAALVLEEAAVNAFKHGGASLVCVEYKDGAFMLMSDGDDFNPLNYQPPQKNDDELSIGGRGIMLMKMLCEKITYNRSDDGLSILTFELKQI